MVILRNPKKNYEYHEIQSILSQYLENQKKKGSNENIGTISLDKKDLIF